MNKHQRILKLYAAGLRLYPKGFREAYGEQTLLTARDTLGTASTSIGKLRVGSHLIIDLLLAAVIENVRHAEENMAKPSQKTSGKSALAAALLGAQIVGIVALSYVYPAGTLQVITAPRAIDTPAVVWYLDSVMPSVVFAVILALTFVLLRRASRLSLWSKITWSYGLWLCGAVGYIMFGNAIDSVVSFYAPNGIPGPVGVGLGLGYDQIVVALIFLTGFYLVVQRLVRLLETSRTTVTK